MKNIIHIIILIGAALTGITGAYAQIPSGDVREETLERAARFDVVGVEEIRPRLVEVRDPFFTDVVFEEEAAVAAAAGLPVEDIKQISDREILALLSERIRPSGVMHFNNENHLLFGERRIKAGDFIAIKYQDINYRLEIMKVESRAFVLRLNDEVLPKRIQ